MVLLPLQSSFSSCRYLTSPFRAGFSVSFSTATKSLPVIVAGAEPADWVVEVWRLAALRLPGLGTGCLWLLNQRICVQPRLRPECPVLFGGSVNGVAFLVSHVHY